MTRVLHLQLHRRRTGVTRHVEFVVRALDEGFEPQVLGAALAPDQPRVSCCGLWGTLRADALFVHAHRNLEVFLGLFLRVIGSRARLVGTRHPASEIEELRVGYAQDLGAES